MAKPDNTPQPPNEWFTGIIKKRDRKIVSVNVATSALFSALAEGQVGINWNIWNDLAHNLGNDNDPSAQERIRQASEFILAETKFTPEQISKHADKLEDNIKRGKRIEITIKEY